ncbi:hypothetical protein GCM10009555_001130 [Acrocarpospora macrocephala]|uniref:Uncharacterized protein n=1 Tax=Acrocarpospora macrocephala TaxID=150177 RepID=A0A5M3X5Q8_9ACTN|nr:hypothetical protein Amac_106330 [Acrocarpospora macrocephala]
MREVHHDLSRSQQLQRIILVHGRHELHVLSRVYGLAHFHPNPPTRPKHPNTNHAARLSPTTVTGFPYLPTL